MRLIIRFLVIASLALILFWLMFPFAVARERYVPGEILVRFRSGTSAADINSINRSIGCEVIRRIEFIQVYQLRITSGRSLEEAVEVYNQNPRVEFAEPNYIGEIAQVPDDPRVINNAETWPADPTFDPARPEYGRQWSLDNWGQTGGTVDADIDAPQMWRMITEADPDIIVAILDTGVDWDHEDLMENIWQNLAEDADGDGHTIELVGEEWVLDPDDLDGFDDDDNNYVDDLIGFDFLENDNDPDDPHKHGTHVAGIIGAVGDNGLGITGVCWRVPLMPVRILDADGHGNTADLCLGIDYAMHGGAKIINMSLQNYEYTHSLEYAVDRANEQGILVVAAAGNSGEDIDVPGQESYPGSLPNPNVITVAASDHDDNRPFWSNWGAISVDLAAPGNAIYSTVPDDDYDYLNGTSMAAPHVSGVAALCWTLERILDPDITHLQVKDMLLDDPTSFNAADKEKKPAFKLGAEGEVLTEGRLRAAQNADFADAPDSPYPTFWPPLGWGALHLDCGLEWLGEDISLERDVLNLDGTDTDGLPNMVDRDGFDDGVTFFPPYFCKGIAPMDRVDVVVTVSNPISGRYGMDKFLYLSSFFDFNDDGDWQDVFTCVAAGDAPEHLLIQTVGGPGAFSVVNPLPDNVVIIDPSLWGPPPTRQSLLFELYFYSPPFYEMTNIIWSRFRLEYDDVIWPTPDHKFVGTEFDYSLFGEVEDYVIETEIPPCRLIQDQNSPVYYFDQFAQGNAVAKYFDATAYCMEPVYPYKIDIVEFYLYDFIGPPGLENGSVDIRVAIYSVFEDMCDGPDNPIYLSEPFTVTTFYPEMTYLYLPEVVCVWEPFFISLEYASGEQGFTPSLLFDDEVFPCDTCHAWVWYEIIESSQFWWEWYQFWEPPIPGCPIIRVTGFTNYPYCEQNYLCGDCNGNGVVEAGDVVYLLGYLFRDQPPPEPLCIGDVNCDGSVSPGDVVCLINYLFRDDDPPCPNCCLWKGSRTSPADLGVKRDLPKMKALPLSIPQAPEIE